MQPLQQPHDYHQMESNLGDEDSVYTGLPLHFRSSMKIVSTSNVACARGGTCICSKPNKHDVKLVHRSHSVES